MAFSPMARAHAESTESTTWMSLWYVCLSIIDVIFFISKISIVTIYHVKSAHMKECAMQAAALDA